MRGEKPDLLGLHDAGAERAHHQLPCKRHTAHNQADYPLQEKAYFSTFSSQNTVMGIQHTTAVLTRTWLLRNQAPLRAFCWLTEVTLSQVRTANAFASQIREL